MPRILERSETTSGAPAMPKPTVLTTVSLLLTLCLAMPLAAGYFGHIHRALDAFSHLRVHLAILMMVTALPMIAGDFIKLGAVAIGAGLLAIASASASVPIPELGMKYGPLYADNGDAAVYRLLQINLRYDNPDTAAVLSLIGRVRPDVITLDEVSASWKQRLKVLAAAYPHGIVCPFPNGLWGVALLSRRPLADATEPFCDRRGAYAVATVDFGGRQTQVAAIHLGWPWPFEQAWQITGLSPYLAKLGDTALLAGDLNAAPWSYSVRRIAEAGGLTLMPSPGPTWLERHLPRFLSFTGLPIDQVMAKGDVMVHSIGKLEDVGSDHYPVLVEFSLRSKPRAPDEKATALVSLPTGAAAISADPS